MKRGALVLAALLLGASALAACDRGQDARPMAASSAASSAPPLAASAIPSAASAASPLAGKWTGSFEAKQYKIEMTREEGTVSAWSKDPGSEASGKGKIELQISNDGRVTGSASGPLGDLQASGAVEGDAVHVQLLPLEPAADKAFTGHMVLARSGPRLSGPLQASTGDSLILRDAAVELRKAP